MLDKCKFSTARENKHFGLRYVLLLANGMVQMPCLKPNPWGDDQTWLLYVITGSSTTRHLRQWPHGLFYTMPCLSIFLSLEACNLQFLSTLYPTESPQPQGNGNVPNHESCCFRKVNRLFLLKVVLPTLFKPDVSLADSPWLIRKCGSEDQRQ